MPNMTQGSVATLLRCGIGFLVMNSLYKFAVESRGKEFRKPVTAFFLFQVTDKGVVVTF